jgi:hypothetical protein
MRVADVVGYIPTFVDAIMTELGATYTWHAVPDTQLPRLFDMLANHTEPDGLDLWVAPRLPQGSYKGRNMFGWQYGTNMAMSHVRARKTSPPQLSTPLQLAQPVHCALYSRCCFWPFPERWHRWPHGQMPTVSLAHRLSASPQLEPATSRHPGAR